MNTQTLNLARKWRSKTFDTIIGQELSLRILKNSLYLDQYFPVYLFAGQRGCGKTTTARVFASAINCEALSLFQKDPKNQPIPCLACLSCRAMEAGKHADFIEIDAASHTGVDNVRMIIESSSLMPLMGRKKIYLIDEAHMLSKAAFNAFLKLMEEPPSSVLFILATTDPQKILETVRSRCLQLFFRPVATNSLQEYLATVCDNEQISYEKKALELVIQESEGSVRDALNLLEQVRFSSPHITAAAVHQVLGHIDDERLLKIFEHVLHQSPANLLHVMQEMHLETYSVEFLWKRWIALLRASIWIKYGKKNAGLADYDEQLSFLLRSVSVARLSAMLETMYRHELLFYRTAAQYPFF